MTGSRMFRWMALPAVLAALVAVPSLAQQGMVSPLGSNSDKPLKIESATLEVRDKSRIATFSGDVKLTQGDMLMRCKVLVVHYEDSAGPPAKAAAPASKTAAPKPAGPIGGQQKIKRVEAQGNVIITQNDQTVTGDNGVFEMKTNFVTVTGNVVVTQGTSVVRGEKMLVELNTGKYTVVSTKGGRVESLFNPGAPTKDAKPAPAPQKDAKPAPAPAPQKDAKPAPAPQKGAPMRLN